MQGLHNRFKSRGANLANPYKYISNVKEILKLMGATWDFLKRRGLQLNPSNGGPVGFL